MPVHGNRPVVERALRALDEHTEQHELIVIDDESPDDTGEPLPGHDGAVVLRNATSVGFVRACNQGAERASGQLLCFLNSDALVQPGWLPHLERLLGDERVGAVVPMLLNEDGSVQEAGAAVGREGITAPLGRGAAPDDPEWSFYP